MAEAMEGEGSIDTELRRNRGSSAWKGPSKPCWLCYASREPWRSACGSRGVPSDKKLQNGGELTLTSQASRQRQMWTLERWRCPSEDQSWRPWSYFARPHSGQERLQGSRSSVTVGRPKPEGPKAAVLACREPWRSACGSRGVPSDRSSTQAEAEADVDA